MPRNNYRSPIRDADLIAVDTDSAAHVRFITEDGIVFDETHALDFMCAVGTEILAAADGVVEEIISDRTKVWGGEDRPPFDVMTLEEEDGNLVILAHDNDEFTHYCHLAPNSSSLAVGWPVKAGDVIGRVGRTGWTVEGHPHVHFVVCRYLEPEGFESIEIQFS